MNWLGHLIQKEINKNDTVLDLGCGIYQATSDSLTKEKFRDANLKCKSVLGCEIVEKYIQRACKYYPTIRFDVTNLDSYKMFADNSFDVVICLDVLEHIDFQIVEKIIGEMKRIARKKAIIYTPSKFVMNEDNVGNAWGMGENPLQIHQSFVSPKYLNSVGFMTCFPAPDHNTLGVFTK